MTSTTTTEPRRYNIGDVVTTTAPIRFLDREFPGWGAANYADFFRDLPAGQVAVVVRIESHGSNPWTRYCISTPDGHRTMGVYPANLTPAR